MVALQALKSDGSLIIPDSLSSDSEVLISSLQMSGLHRTESEIRNGKHISMFTTGDL